MTKESRIVLIFTTVVVVAVILVAVIWWVPQLQVNPIRHDLSSLEAGKLENDYRVTIAQIMGGFGILLGIYLTWRRIAATERQARAFEEQIGVAQDGQITERFTRAIDQLGHKNLEIRLGGIYALERIAQDSKKDHWTIMEVLTAYVRENARWEEPPGSDAAEDEALGVQRLRPDIQAILTVLGRRRLVHEEGASVSLSLPETDLRGASLSGAHLEGADLSDARLEGAHLGNAHLERANLGNTHLEGADLSDARLEGAHLGNAHLGGANLWFAHPEQAHLRHAHLEGTDVRHAHLEGADFFRAHLDEADLRSANLRGAGLVRARLAGANLLRADLEGADLRYAHFEGADLRLVDLERADVFKANLEGANLLRAKLTGAELRYAVGLTKEQVEMASTDDRTKLPDYLLPTGEGEEQPEVTAGGG